MIIVLLLTSCANIKKATYFNDIPNSQFKSNLENLEPVLSENDLLSISVSSLNPGATEVFNPMNSSERARNNENLAPEYLIDEDGYIHFPFLGKIEAAGKTKKNYERKLRMN